MSDNELTPLDYLSLYILFIALTAISGLGFDIINLYYIGVNPIDSQIITLSFTAFVGVFLGMVLKILEYSAEVSLEDE